MGGEIQGDWVFPITLKNTCVSLSHCFCVLFSFWTKILLHYLLLRYYNNYWFKKYKPLASNLQTFTHEDIQTMYNKMEVVFQDSNRTYCMSNVGVDKSTWSALTIDRYVPNNIFSMSTRLTSLSRFKDICFVMHRLLETEYCFVFCFFFLQKLRFLANRLSYFCKKILIYCMKKSGHSSCELTLSERVKRPDLHGLLHKPARG